MLVACTWSTSGNVTGETKGQAVEATAAADAATAEAKEEAEATKAAAAAAEAGAAATTGATAAEERNQFSDHNGWPHVEWGRSLYWVLPRTPDQGSHA